MHWCLHMERFTSSFGKIHLVSSCLGWRVSVAKFPDILLGGYIGLGPLVVCPLKGQRSCVPGGGLTGLPPGAYADLPHPTRMTLRVWMVTRKRFYRQNSSHPFNHYGVTLIFHTSGPSWSLRDIMPTGTLLVYRDLLTKFNLPRLMCFRYCQRHAARAQFPGPFAMIMDPIEELLAQE